MQNGDDGVAELNQDKHRLAFPRVRIEKFPLGQNPLLSEELVHGLVRTTLSVLR